MDSPELDRTETERDIAAGEEILAFWELARRDVGLGRLGVIVGPSPTESVPPPAWAFGDSPELADQLLELVLEGTKTATASVLSEYEAEAEPLPREDDLSIILDGRGHPRALVRTTAVRVVPFDEVDAEHALLEGEGDRSLETWRADHRAAFERRGATGDEPAGAAEAAFDSRMPVVLEQFELRFPRRSHPEHPTPS